MSYVPNNLEIFLASFAGAVAGLGGGRGQTPTTNAAQDNPIANVALAFAESYDTVWGVTPSDSYQNAGTEEICEAAWESRGVPPLTAPAFTASTYTKWCTALIAAIVAGSTVLSGQGIVPPPPALGGTLQGTAPITVNGDNAPHSISGALSVAIGSPFTIYGASSVATIATANVLTADGSFTTPAGWTIGAGWAIAAGNATHTGGNVASLDGTSTAIDTTAVYRVRFTLTVGVAGTGVLVSLGGQDSGAVFSAPGTFDVYILPLVATGTLSFGLGAGGTFAGTLDNVSIHAVTPSTADQAIVSSDAGPQHLELRITSGNAFNTFVGYQAGAFALGIYPTAGSDSTGFGYQALRSCAGGNFNSAFGSASLWNLAQGDRNTACGAGALQGARTINGCTALGYAAGYNNTQDNLTAIGLLACQSNTTGRFVCAVGAQALQLNTIGDFCTALGANAMQASVSALNCTAVGYAALSGATPGNYCTAIGAGALVACNGGAGNTACGINAGASVTGGANNCFLGINADVSNGNLNNASAIGNRAVVGASNTCMLGAAGANAQNVAIGNDGSGSGGMQGGILITAAQVAPAGNPAAGTFCLYVDPGDGHLKAKNSAGVVTVLAL